MKNEQMKQRGINMLRGKKRLDMEHSRYGRFCGFFNLKIF